MNWSDPWFCSLPGYRRLVAQHYPKEHEFLCKLEAAGFELVGVIGDGFDRRELYFRGPTHGHRVTVELNPKEAIKVERWDLDVFDEYSTFWIQRAIYLGSVF